ncbi:MAG: hypothetical protein J6P83_07185 [Bacteroidales bacterium]|nr:hypothetical protein [Bacteroidales bacterium]
MKTRKLNKVLAALVFVGLMLVSQGLTAQSNTPNNSAPTTEDKVNAVIQALEAISNAIQQQNNNNAVVPQNSNNGNYNNGNNGGYNSNFNSTPTYQQPRKKTPCAHCNHTGKCPYCDGKGVRLNQFSHEKVTCMWCNGNGRCHWCNGNGEL